MIAPAVNVVPCVLVSRPRICAETPGNTAFFARLFGTIEPRETRLFFFFFFCVARVSSIESGASTLLLASARKGKFVSR